jgi:methionyl aminopeptidase
MSIHIKSPAELLLMREAGKILARTLGAVREAAKPGVTTAELDKVAADTLRKLGSYSPFVNYPDRTRKHPYPASINASVNEELVHGLPGPRRLEEGDILSIDCGSVYKGYIADSAFTMGIGKISAEAQRLLDVTEQALWVGIKSSVVGNETRDVSSNIQAFIEKHGYSVVREYTGHGVGRKMHEEPQVPNWWPPRQKRHNWRSYPLQPGMTYALEPMVNAGGPETKELDDFWTVVTADGSLCAHFEHTLAVTDGEPLILTLPE